MATNTNIQAENEQLKVSLSVAQAQHTEAEEKRAELEHRLAWALDEVLQLAKENGGAEDDEQRGREQRLRETIEMLRKENEDLRTNLASRNRVLMEYVRADRDETEEKERLRAQIAVLKREVTDLKFVRDNQAAMLEEVAREGSLISPEEHQDQGEAA